MWTAWSCVVRFALWRQTWIRLKNESNCVPEVAVAALEACGQTTFPLIHSYLPVNTCHTTREYCQCCEKLLHSTASQDVVKVSSYRRQADEFGIHEYSSWHTSRRRQGYWSHWKGQASLYSVHNLKFIYLERPITLSMSTIIMSRSIPANLNSNTNFRTLQCSKITKLMPFGSTSDHFICMLYLYRLGWFLYCVGKLLVL